jgi:hypothetical protein
MAATDFVPWARALTAPPDGATRPYRSYPVTFARLAALVERGVVAEQVGASCDGEPLWAFAVEPSLPTRATTFVLAGLHAMEHVGVATAIALLERAVATPWRDRRLVVVPLANPDGFRAVERSLADGRRRFLRKNARGVDLNRNFASFWDRDYYLCRLAPGIFAAGSAPLSEPEAQAVDHALGRFRPSHAVSLHAFGRWIFTPYAGSRAAPARAAELLATAQAMAACQPSPYRVMQLGLRSRLFQARGAEIDHMYDRHGALSLLIEIGAGPRFRHPDTWLEPYRWFSPPDRLLEADVAEVVPAVEYLAGV